MRQLGHRVKVATSWGYVYLRGYPYCFCQLFQGLCLFRGIRLLGTLEYAKLQLLLGVRIVSLGSDIVALLS